MTLTCHSSYFSCLGSIVRPYDLKTGRPPLWSDLENPYVISEVFSVWNPHLNHLKIFFSVEICLGPFWLFVQRFVILVKVQLIDGPSPFGRNLHLLFQFTESIHHKCHTQDLNFELMCISSKIILGTGPLFSQLCLSGSLLSLLILPFFKLYSYTVDSKSKILLYLCLTSSMV